MTLALDDVAVAYRGRTIVSGLTFTVATGEIVGLLGPNGIGKTTVLRVAAGFIRPSMGRVRCGGPLVYFGGEQTLPGSCRADRWSSLVAPQLTGVTRQRLARLSRGTRQMIGLRAWLSQDDWGVALLDEPWEGLDPDGARWLRESIAAHRARNAAVIVSSHRLHDVAEVCDTYAFLGPAGLRVVRARELPGQRGDAASLMAIFDDIVRMR